MKSSHTFAHLNLLLSWSHSLLRTEVLLLNLMIWFYFYYIESQEHNWDVFFTDCEPQSGTHSQSCLTVCPCDPGRSVLVGFLKAHFNSRNLEQSTDPFTLNEHREESPWQGIRACFPAKGGRAVQRRTGTVYSFQHLLRWKMIKRICSPFVLASACTSLLLPT